MICPQTKAECDSDYGCKLMGCRVAPPPPTLAEIERLITEHEINTRSRNTEQEESRAALIAAYRQLTNDDA